LAAKILGDLKIENIEKSLRLWNKAATTF